MENDDDFKAAEKIVFNEKKGIVLFKGNNCLKVAGNWDDEKKMGFFIKFKNFQIGFGIRLRESMDLLFGFRRQNDNLPD